MPVPSDNKPAVVTSYSSSCPVRINPGFVDSVLTNGGDSSSETDNSATITVWGNELQPKNRLKGLKHVSRNIASLLKHLDELRIFVEEENLTSLELMKHDLIIRLMTLILKLMAVRSCAGMVRKMVVALLYTAFIRFSGPGRLSKFEVLTKLPNRGGALIWGRALSKTSKIDKKKI